MKDKKKKEEEKEENTNRIVKIFIYVDNISFAYNVIFYVQ